MIFSTFDIIDGITDGFKRVGAVERHFPSDSARWRFCGIGRFPGKRYVCDVSGRKTRRRLTSPLQMQWEGGGVF